MCPFQQGTAIGSVVAVVLQRVGDGLGHNGVRREVHHRVNIVFLEDPIEQRCVTGVANDQLAGGDSGLKTGSQIIEGDYVLTGVAQLLNNVTPYITGTAGDKDALVCHVQKSRLFRAEM